MIDDSFVWDNLSRAENIAQTLAWLSEFNDKPEGDGVYSRLKITLDSEITVNQSTASSRTTAAK